MKSVTVTCQQQDIYKIRDGVPGHGPQIVQSLMFHDRPKPSRPYVHLACGCFLPVSYMPRCEADLLREMIGAAANKMGEEWEEIHGIWLRKRAVAS